MTRRPGFGKALVVLVLVQLGIVGLFVARERRGATGRVTVEERAERGHDLVVEGPDGTRRFIVARSGEFQLVHFWATWCPPCRDELPALLELTRRRPGPLQIWAVSTDPGWDEVTRFFGHSIPQRVVRDPTGAAHTTYAVTGLPDTYLLDPEGRVVARFAGAQDWKSRKMEKVLDRLLGPVD